MSTDDPYSLDFFQTIKNVHFGGIAAEYSSASCISLGTGIPNFSKAIISFWFRVPSASLDAADADADARADTPDLKFVGIIPLVSFGAMGTYTTYNVGGDPNLNFTTDVGPSYIGIHCGPKDGPDFSAPVGHTLYTRIQYDNGGGWFRLPDPLDYAANTNQPDFFETGSSGTGSFHLEGPERDINYIDVDPDIWHHVLVSFDVSDGSSAVTVDGGGDVTFGALSKIWIAFDDVNYDGPFLQPCGAASYQPFGADPNAIASMFSLTTEIGLPPTSVPTGGKPIGIPTSKDNADPFSYHVEIALPQMWTGITLDTSDTVKRRLFIDDDGKPVPVEVAEDALGTPLIRFTSSRSLIKGTNSGSGKNFSPTGKIKSYKPDPELGA
jgi:hypothetical protein